MIRGWISVNLATRVQLQAAQNELEERTHETPKKVSLT